MNQKQYSAIRNGLNLKFNPYFLPTYLTQTAILLGIIGICMTRFSHSPFKFFAIPLISILMFRSFALMHEAVHGLASKNRNLNQSLGVISGALCLLSYESWRQAHLEHHNWSGNLDKDPVMAMIKIFPKFPKPLRAVLTWGWNAWVPTLSFLQHTVFWSITVRYTLRNPKSPEQLASVIFPIAFWLGLLLLTPAHLVLTLIAPSIVLYLIGTEIINAPHHLGLNYYRGDTKIPLWEQYKTARTCVYPKWLARFVVLNFNYHSEHHMYPSMPWYHLDKIHRAVHPMIQNGYNLDPRFSWIIKNRTLDLATVFGSAQAAEPVKQPDQAQAA